MITDFHGWRPKTGVATLVLACVFTGEWIRGFAIEDVIRLGTGRGRVLQTLSTSHGGLVWKIEETDCDISWVTGYTPRPVQEINDPSNCFVNADFMDWRWQMFGLDFAEYHGVKADRLSFWLIQYPTIVVPLILISAWLLFSKPRSAKLKNTAEPILEGVS